MSIASRVVPGISRDDRPLLAEQRVEQARLADVRPPDERDRGRLVVGLGGDRRVPLRGLGVAVAGVAVGAVAVVRSSSSASRVADDERLEPARGDLARPRLGLRLARLAGELLPRSRAAAPRRSRRAGRRCPRPCDAEIG